MSLTFVFAVVIIIIVTIIISSNINKFLWLKNVYGVFQLKRKKKLMVKLN
jgi:hypothetical protein